MQKLLIPAYDVRLYLGDKTMDGVSIPRRDIVEFIRKAQKSSTQKVPVRISETFFLSEDYEENGWEIAAIAYPHRLYPKDQIWQFMESLAHNMVERFAQNRICITDGEKTKMFPHKQAKMS